MFSRHRERHRTEHIGWLRAAVLGANDGIVSTASLVLGVAAADGTHSNILVAGVAGLVAGAMSMAAGEYVSVHSQADTERADLEQERARLRADSEAEHDELTAIYEGRGLDPSLARQVAGQLMAHDALGAHARDELGISGPFQARPVQAALASAGSFACGAAMPLLVSAVVPAANLIPVVAGWTQPWGVSWRWWRPEPWSPTTRPSRTDWSPCGCRRPSWSAILNACRPVCRRARPRSLPTS